MQKIIRLNPAAAREDLFCSLTETPLQDMRRAARRRQDAIEAANAFTVSEAIQTAALFAVSAAAIIACFLLAV